MRHWKLLLVMLIALALVLVACGTTEEATQAPTEAPTEAPMEAPTEAPTEAPMEEPTEAPMEEPTEAPTAEPTEEAMPEEMPELEVTDIALGFGVDAVFAPHIVGINKGWFEEAGFTSVETPTFTAGALAGEALAAGEIQLWTPGNVPPISMVHNGLPIVIVGVNTDAYIEKLAVRADAGVEQPEDLYNIKIGLLEGSTASAVLANIAEHYDLDVNQMQVVNLPPPEQLTALVNNDVQAMLVWNPWTYQAQQELGEENVIIMHNGTQANFPWDQSDWQSSYTLSVWAMGEDFIRESPNSAKALMDVLLRGQEYVRDPANREEVLNMLAEWNDQPYELLDALWDDYHFDPTIGDTYMRDMQEYTDFLFNAGRIESEMDPLDYTYTGFLADYNPDYVQTEGNWQP